MAKARIVYNGDWVYTTKVGKNLKLVSGVEQAIDNIPGIVDNAESESTSDALSAHMGKVLQDQITDLQWIWTFLSGWDCTTWLPITDPREDPYVYKAGNYYIVVNVGTWDNFKPHWSQYQRWTASITVELDAVWLNDRYMYDWADWVRIPAWNRSMEVDNALSTSSVRPVENRVITNKINDMVDNSALSASWSWDTAHTPSKDAVYNALLNVATLMWVSINDIINPPQP